jgi:4-amino-4-deoxy-L-arabinose transferase-like glycosyltransferase
MVAGARTFSLEDTLLAPQILDPPPTRHALFAFLLALAAILHIGTAAWGDLYDGVEGQVAGTARDMVSSGQWLVPTNNDVPILHTPPLTYWAVALSCKIFGVTATAVRLPIALAMIGTVALTFLIGERLSGYWRGFAAGLIFLCSTGAFVFGRLAAPDSLVALFVCGAIYCAVCGYQRQKLRKTWFAGVWFCAALATFTKGPAAILWLGVILGLLSIFFREARLRFAGLLHWRNIVLFTAIAAPWFIWMERQVPGFLSSLFSFQKNAGSQTHISFVVSHLIWWFPAVFLVLPGFVFAPRKIFRPTEVSFADTLPLCWVAAVVLLELFLGTHDPFSDLAAAPGFALLAACAWERMSRALRAIGIVLALVVAVGFAACACLRPALIGHLFNLSFDAVTWSSLYPLAEIAATSFVVFSVIALFVVKQRGEIVLVVVLGAMVPAGFCLVESGSRADAFVSLSNAARYLNPRLGGIGAVLYEGSLRSGSSLSFYLDRHFFFVNQSPAPFEHDAASPDKYLDEHLVVEAWDRSDPIYLIIDETRLSYWRELITERVHIYHQVTTCGSRVVLSNQL